MVVQKSDPNSNSPQKLVKVQGIVGTRNRLDEDRGRLLIVPEKP